MIYSFGTLLEFLHTKYNLMENNIQTTKLLFLMCVERGEGKGREWRGREGL